jgi:hypothetical protein
LSLPKNHNTVQKGLPNFESLHQNITMTANNVTYCLIVNNFEHSWEKDTMILIISLLIYETKN